MVATMALTSTTCATIRSRDRPVSPTRATPWLTCWVEVEIRPLISFAASAERCARARTSEATTAKPLPASPARAASTPAFKASKLVCMAMSSITTMIWLICLDEVSIAAMASTA